MVTIYFLSVLGLFFSAWESSVVFLGVLFITMWFFGFRQLTWNCLDAEFGLDSVGWALSILSVFVILMIFFNEIPKMSAGYMVCLKLILLILILAFSAGTMIKFYMWFELSLVPTFIIIMGWGGQPERIKATVYFIMYTVAASLPLFLVLMMFSNSGVIFFSGLAVVSSKMSVFLISGCLLAFLVKIPLYFFHLWLIKAHVEAPAGGSMILASILLKLGGYGLYRVASAGVLGGSLAETLVVWSLLGGVLASVACFMSQDIKVMIALSSVAHMSMVISGVSVGAFYGVSGAVVVMVGHGFCSSALFFWGGVMYKLSGSRSFKFLKGLGVLFPVFSLLWFMMISSNMSAPPSLNLVGEIQMIISFVMWSKFLIFPASMLVFLAGAYSFSMYVKSQSGEPSPGVSPAANILLSDMMVGVLHWVPLSSLVLGWEIMVNN